MKLSQRLAGDTANNGGETGDKMRKIKHRIVRSKRARLSVVWMNSTFFFCCSTRMDVAMATMAVAMASMYVKQVFHASI